MKKLDFYFRLSSLGLVQSDYVVIGSGILVALDLREADDIDLVVSGSVFMKFESNPLWEKKYFEDGTYYLTHNEFEIGLDWDSESSQPNLKQLKIDEMVIDGVPFVSLKRLYNWKKQKNRPKDIRDLRLIDDYFSTL